MAAEIGKGVLEDVRAVEIDDLFLEVDGDGGVFDERIQQVVGHPLIGVPVTRPVAKPHECKFFRG